MRTKCNRKVTATTQPHILGLDLWEWALLTLILKILGVSFLCPFSWELSGKTYSHPSVSLLKNDHTLAGLKQQTLILSSCGAGSLQRSCCRATPLRGLQEGMLPRLSGLLVSPDCISPTNVCLQGHMAFFPPCVGDVTLPLPFSSYKDSGH